MTLGFEARWISLPTTGFGSYARNLLVHMPEIDPSRKYVIYSNRAVADHLLPARPNTEIRVVGGRSAFYKHILLPGRVRRTGDIDLFHFLYNAPSLVFPVRYVLTIHDLSYIHVPEMISLRDRLSIQGQLRLKASQARHIIAISKNSKRDVVEILGIDPDHVSVIYNAVDEQFHPRIDPEVKRQVQQKYHLPRGYVLYVGTYLPHKNLGTLLRAFRCLLDRGLNDFSLVFAGGKGRNFLSIGKTISELGLADSVQCLGFVDDADLPAVYAMADLFVFPSLYEGFGMPLLEAMACGTPVLASNTSSLPEVGGEAVEYFDPRSVEELAFKLAALLGDQARRKALSDAGTERAALFTWRKTAEQTLKIYDHIAITDCGT